MASARHVVMLRLCCCHAACTARINCVVQLAALAPEPSSRPLGVGALLHATNSARGTCITRTHIMLCAAAV